MTPVALIAQEKRRRAVRDAVDAFQKELRAKIGEHSRIFIKPDIQHFDLQLSSTHPDALRGLLDALRSFTNVPIIIGDASNYGTREAFSRLGFLPIIDEYPDVSFVDLQEEPVIECEIERAGVMTPVRRARRLQNCDVTISLASLKTHADYGVALSVATFAEGTWIVPPRQTPHGKQFSRAPWLHAQGDRGMHELLAGLYMQFPATFAVIDGTLGMEGDGPLYGNPVPVGVAIAGLDAVAVDAVAASIMGFDPQEIGYLRFCAAGGCGIVEMAKIDVPPHLLNDVVRPFALPPETRQRLTSWME
ncbi:DUF362 domain-containing protein [Patescibacteria group bacterium]|jgi:uncharacterized protein (DUF362 family)|nr:DUF362 domain-containing protein [Patescibacteria group bacterium]